MSHSVILLFNKTQSDVKLPRCMWPAWSCRSKTR